MEEQLKGQFWMPNDSSLKHFGEIALSIVQKQYKIILYGTFPEFDPLHNNINFHEDIPCMYGFTRDGKFVTLLDLRIIGANLSSAPAESSAFKSEHQLSFKQFIYGPVQLRYGSLINRVSVTAQFMEAWGKTDPILTEMNRESATGEPPSKSYHLRPGEPTSIPFGQDICTFYDYLTHKQQFNINRLEVKQQNCLHFIFQQDLEIGQLYFFVKRFREFYTLITGVNLGLNRIVIHSSDTEETEFQYEFDDNVQSGSYSFVYGDNRILGLKELSVSEYLKFFFDGYDRFRLPLSHYIRYLNSDRSDRISFVQPFVSALEIIYNKCHRDENNNPKEMNQTLMEILSTYKLSPKHRQFLLSSKLAKTYRDLHLKDKILALIAASAKLTELVENPLEFTRRVLDLIHYLVHEVDKELTDLSLLHNPILLAEHIVKLKVILEYHLLIMMGLDREIVEKRIDRTLPNFAHFKRH